MVLTCRLEFMEPPLHNAGASGCGVVVGVIDVGDVLARVVVVLGHQVTIEVRSECKSSFIFHLLRLPLSHHLRMTS